MCEAQGLNCTCTGGAVVPPFLPVLKAPVPEVLHQPVVRGRPRDILSELPRPLSPYDLREPWGARTRALQVAYVGPVW